MAFKVEISGFTTKAQAEQFVHCYERQGEQYIWGWLECQVQEGGVDCTSLNTDLRETFPLEWKGDVLKMVVSPA